MLNLQNNQLVEVKFLTHYLFLFGTLSWHIILTHYLDEGSHHVENFDKSSWWEISPYWKSWHIILMRDLTILKILTHYLHEMRYLTLTKSNTSVQSGAPQFSSTHSSPVWPFWSPSGSPPGSGTSNSFDQSLRSFLTPVLQKKKSTEQSLSFLIVKPHSSTPCSFNQSLWSLLQKKVHHRFIF